MDFREGPCTQKGGISEGKQIISLSLPSFEKLTVPQTPFVVCAAHDSKEAGAGIRVCEGVLSKSRCGTNCPKNCSGSTTTETLLLSACLMLRVMAPQGALLDTCSRDRRARRRGRAGYIPNGSGHPSLARPRNGLTEGEEVRKGQAERKEGGGGKCGRRERGLFNDFGPRVPRRGHP